MTYDPKEAERKMVVAVLQDLRQKVDRMMECDKQDMLALLDDTITEYQNLRVWQDSDPVLWLMGELDLVTINALNRHGIYTIGELSAKRYGELDRIRNLGFRRMESIVAALAKRGRGLA